MTTSFSKALELAFGNRCPQCQEGAVFTKLVFMNKYCPHCKYEFSREPGYFTGAMFIQYMVSAFMTLPILIFAAYQGSSAVLIRGAIFACVLIAFSSPFVFRYSRLIWLHLDFKSQQQA